MMGNIFLLQLFPCVAEIENKMYILRLSVVMSSSENSVLSY